MAKLAKLLQAAAGAGGAEALNVEDVFSTYLYEGDGTSSHTITNGVDYTAEDYLVWIKDREYTGGGGEWHQLYDTVRGATKILASNSTGAEYTESYGLKTFNSDGFTLGQSNAVNRSGSDIVAWTFRKAPKFFDVVTYTGTGSATTISHNLGSVPGCIIVKCTSNARDWYVYHRGSNGGTNPEQYKLNLNSTAASATETDAWNDTAPTSSVFTVGSVSNVNASGFTYVAYLFAHNDGDGEFGPTGDQDIIKCGSYSGTTTVDLGFEPQFLLRKRVDSTGNWAIQDTMRGWGPFNSSYEFDYLLPNTSDAEGTSYGGVPTSTGFTNYAPGDYIYIAIRRGPMAVPTDAADVFSIDTDIFDAGGTPAAEATQDVVDFVIYPSRSTSEPRYTGARLTQASYLATSSNAIEVANANAYFDYMYGFNKYTGDLGNYIAYMWKRAPSFCDVVTYSGNGTAGHTINHNLGVVPEMIWVKARDLTQNWAVYNKDFVYTEAAYLNTNGAPFDSSAFNSTAPTSSVFTVGSNDTTNSNSGEYIAILFASLDGVSKIGSYTGNGTNQNIDCGFSSGASFVLIKRTDQGGSWSLFDTTRGIVAGSDPRFELNTTAAEDTSTDSIDPYSAGFNVTQSTAHNLNVNNATYIFYAIA